MPDAKLIPAGTAVAGDQVNVFVHGYRSMVSDSEVEKAKARVQRTGVPGESYLLRWMAGRWADSATVVGLRAAYRATRLRYLISPASVLIDAGLIGVNEAAQFKRMEWRAAKVGQQLPALLGRVAGGRPINLIAHSLGARVVHHCLAEADLAGLLLRDVVLLAGAADLKSDNWPECVARLDGRLYNGYSHKDRILKITPDLRRRVGSRPLPQVLIDGVPKVVNHQCIGYGHVQSWTRLPELLPQIWPACCGASQGDTETDA
ncbi:MAG: DUF726 domain-containing protein [Planctomycetota bacterium]